jgi:hypothetical protein
MKGDDGLYEMGSFHGAQSDCIVANSLCAACAILSTVNTRYKNIENKTSALEYIEDILISRIT